MVIKLGTLNKLFDGHMNGIPITSAGTCRDCGKPVAIEIDRVAGGYGLKGGVVYEIGKWQFVVRCETCHQASSKPDNVGKSSKAPVESSLMDVSFFSKLNNLRTE